MLVFVHINKTAGTTIRRILRGSFGSRHCEVEQWHGAWQDPPFSAPDLARLRRIYPNLKSIAGHGIKGYPDLHQRSTEFRYFTFIRDPLKVCASRYQYRLDHKKKNDLTFEEWIQKDPFRNTLTNHIAGSDSAADAISVIESKRMFVGLSERFDESLVLLKALLASDLNIGYRSVNVAKSKGISSQLLSTPATRDALIEANQADLELYDYVKKELYPSLQREFGPSLDEAVAEHRSNSLRGFNNANVTASRLKQYSVYRPLLHLYRARPTGKIFRKLLS